MGSAKEKESYLRATQLKAWKFPNYKDWARMIMNAKLRMFAYKIERRGTSELSQIEDLEAFEDEIKP